MVFELSARHGMHLVINMMLCTMLTSALVMEVLVSKSLLFCFQDWNFVQTRPLNDLSFPNFFTLFDEPCLLNLYSYYNKKFHS